MKKHKSYNSFSAIHSMKENNEFENHHSVGEDHGVLLHQNTPSGWLKNHRRAKSMSPMPEKKIHTGYVTLNNEEEDEWSGIDGSFGSAVAMKNNTLSPVIMKSKALVHMEQFQFPQKVEKIIEPTKMSKNGSESDSEGTVSTKLCNSQSDSYLSFSGSDVQRKESSKSVENFLPLTESDENHKDQIHQDFGDLVPPSGSDMEQKEVSKKVTTEPKSKTIDDIIGMITTDPSACEAETKPERPLKYISATPSEEERMHNLLNDDSVPKDRRKWWEDENRKKKYDSTHQGSGFIDIINSILDGCQALGLCVDDEDEFRIGREIHIDRDQQSHVFDDITFDQSFARQSRWRSEI